MRNELAGRRIPSCMHDGDLTSLQTFNHDVPRRANTHATLPVLESAARLQSFSAAAAELNVTHGAISHQIRLLEEHLGIALFASVSRRVELTAEGAMLAEAARAVPVVTTDYRGIGNSNTPQRRR